MLSLSQEASSPWERFALGGLAAVTLTAYFYCSAVSSSWGLWVYLLCWAAVLAVRPSLILEHFQGWLIWLLPALCMLSTAWSRWQSLTFKQATEYIVFTLAVMTMAKVVGRRSTLLAVIAALVVVVGISLATGTGGRLFSSPGTIALRGIYASKNFLVFNCAVLSVSALVGALDKGFPLVARLFCVGAICLGVIVGYMGHSLGGLVAMVVAMMFVLVTALGSRLAMSLRFSLVALLLATITVIVVGFLVVPPDLLGEALRSVGKSSDLTGRTLLWAQAQLEMEQHPWLGIGFAAYWHPEFYDALGLYRALGIDAMTGFHFHNLFYESAVELGYVGVLVMAITLLSITGKGLARFVINPSISSSFTLGVMTLLLSRVYLEVDFLSPFSEGTFLVTLCYAFLKPDPVVLGSRAKLSFRNDDITLQLRNPELQEGVATPR